MGPGGNVKINSAPVLRAIAQAQTKIDEGIALFAAFDNLHRRVADAVLEVGKAASGSRWGYHSTIYLEGFRAPFPGEAFDAEWGETDAFSNRTNGPWRTYEHRDVETEVLKQAAVSEADWNAYCALAESAQRMFVDARTHALPSIEAFAEATASTAVASQAAKIAALVPGYAVHQLTDAMPQLAPVTRDARALQGGRPVPAHAIIMARAISVDSRRKQLEELRMMLRTAGNQVSSFASIRQSEEEESISMVDKKKVFVVHGRNTAARDTVYAFLRALELSPIEWGHAVQLVGSGTAYTGEVIEAAFAQAQAIVILFTGEDVSYLRPDLDGGKSETPGYQPRQNVLIEAGMAMQRDRKRTVIVQFGVTRTASDFHGLQELRYEGCTDAEFRNYFVAKLTAAGCTPNQSGSSWFTAGNFDALAKQSVPLATQGPSPVGTSAAIDRLRKLGEEAPGISFEDSGERSRVTMMTEACVKTLFPDDAEGRISELRKIHFYGPGDARSVWRVACVQVGHRINSWLLELEFSGR